MEIRELKKKELKLLKNALRYFGSEKFFETHTFFVVEDGKKNLFMCTSETYKLISNFGKAIEVKWAGIKVGEIGSKRVRFTLEGAYYLAGKRKRVFVGEKGEMLFLYGRDIFASSITGWDSDIKQNDIVFVANGEGDIIGIGKMRYPPEKIKDLRSDEVVVENLVDRGEYLRKERLYDAF